MLLARALGLWVGDAIVWPVFAALVGALLIWQESSRLPWLSLPREAARRGASGLAPTSLGGQAMGRALGTVAAGASLVLGAILLFLWANGAISKVSSAVLTVVAVLVAFTLILAPLWVRVLRSLTAERAERERSQERTAVAAHLHDSVLQTLALIQRRAQEPREVAALARRQERELRAWLSGAERANAGSTFTTAIEDAATDVEVAHGVLVEVVVVGGRPLDEAGEAVVAAAREAIVNAAKFAGDGPIAVYAELTRERVEIFIRDRGPGFELELVPVDRRGLRDSIIGRMTRYGGRATVISTPGQGTEITLSLKQAVRA
jgi:signal transduction histidine kinase